MINQSYCLESHDKLKHIGHFSTSRQRRIIMNPHRIACVALILIVLTFSTESAAKTKPKVPSGGKLAIVVDERLSPLRSKPEDREGGVRYALACREIPNTNSD